MRARAGVRGWVDVPVLITCARECVCARERRTAANNSALFYPLNRHSFGRIIRLPQTADTHARARRDTHACARTHHLKDAVLSSWIVMCEKPKDGSLTRNTIKYVLMINNIKYNTKYKIGSK